MSEVLDDQQIHERLMASWVARPDDPRLEAGMSFGEGLALSQDASRAASDRVMRIAALIESAHVTPT